MEFDLEDDFDFGFTSVPTDSVVPATDVDAAQKKAQLMYNAVMPLLNNLAKDADKNDYILWAGRATKIEAFKKKLSGILNS